MPIFFTIITATRNAAVPLPRLLESLAGQTCRHFELIIQDGASDDGTPAVAESYRSRLPALTMASEPDKGVYDAWNKALPHAGGEWLLFLGADDQLYDQHTLAKLFAFLQGLPSHILFAPADVLRVSPGGETLNVIPGKAEGARERLRSAMPFCHSSLVHRAALFADQAFDISYAIAGDYDFLCRMWTDDHIGKTVGFPITRMGATGLSSLPENRFRTIFETVKIRRKYFHNIWNAATLVPLAKSIILLLVCKALGRKKAPRFLDRLRALRGLPPVWEAQGRDTP